MQSVQGTYLGTVFRKCSPRQVSSITNFCCCGFSPRVFKQLKNGLKAHTPAEGPTPQLLCNKKDAGLVFLRERLSALPCPGQPSTSEDCEVQNGKSNGSAKFCPQTISDHLFLMISTTCQRLSTQQRSHSLPQRKAPGKSLHLLEAVGEPKVGRNLCCLPLLSLASITMLHMPASIRHLYCK